MDGLEVLDGDQAARAAAAGDHLLGHGNIDTAVSAVSRGAVDFIEKPFEAERLLHLVGRATETERLRRENARLREGSALAEEFTGKSSAINQVRATLKRVANTGSSVPITGPAGSGKEVAARLLHSWSPRADKTFVTVNSARITPERFEQELFGEEADGKLVRPGLLEMADGGTLYLDEVADMPISTQARILRVLTDQSFVRAGGNRQIGVDVRVVSSTARDLEKEIAEKRFREDLFYRLNVVPVVVPSLADRRDDVPALADHFFTRYAREQGLPAPRHRARGARRAAGVRLAGQRAPAAQRGRAHRDPGPARPHRPDRARHAARGDHRPHARERRRHVVPDGRAAARSARELRARVPADPDPPVLGQHLEDRGVHRHGALGAAPKA